MVWFIGYLLVGILYFCFMVAVSWWEEVEVPEFHWLQWVVLFLTWPVWMILLFWLVIFRLLNERKK